MLPQTVNTCPGTCSQCPFAEDRYAADGEMKQGRLYCYHNNQVVREHWEPTGDCLEALAKRQAREMQPAPVVAPQPQPMPKATEEEWEQRMRVQCRLPGAMPAAGTLARSHRR